MGFFLDLFVFNSVHILKLLPTFPLPTVSNLCLMLLFYCWDGVFRLIWSVTFLMSKFWCPFTRAPSSSCVHHIVCDKLQVGNCMFSFNTDFLLATIP